MFAISIRLRSNNFSFFFVLQDRKKFFPPRPRGNKKARNSKKKTVLPVKLENLRSALNGLSQDSGIGSSQEMPSTFPSTDELVLPEEPIKTGTSVMPSSITTRSASKLSRKSSMEEPSQGSGSFSSNDLGFSKNNRKRYISESSLSDFEIKKPKLDEKSSSQTSDLGSEISTSSFSSSQIEAEKLPARKRELSDAKVAKTTDTVGKSTTPPMQNEKENSELCIICNNAPKDSIFLHTNMAHQCCCYRCAKRTLHTIKRCPICNRSVNKVVKIYTS